MYPVRPTLAASIALSLLASVAAAQPQVTQAVVEQSAAGSYRLRWSGPPSGTPVDVFVADQPNAPRKALKLIVNNDIDGEAAISPLVKGRPYFYVAANQGAGVWTAERVLPLEGGRNFRDLGGYGVADGRRVKWGRIYRSGSMAELTLTDYDYLSNLGIRVVCDLRTPEERHAEPNKWQQVAKVSYWTRDYAMSFGELRKLMASGLPTAQQAKEAMMAGYRELPFEQAPAYRELFKRLAAGEIPLAFNCSAGKDRAGTAAALILTALGVPRETVTKDYALSDKVVDFRRTYAAKANGRSSPLEKMPPDIVTAILSSDPDYIRAALAAIEERHGSVEQYLQDELDVTARDLDAIRQQLLE
jgi:protein-tyrosine phosphatase